MEYTAASKTKPNYFYVILSVAVVLLLLGLFGMLWLYAREFVSLMKERVNVMVEIKPETSREDITKVENVLSISNYVKQSSVHFVTRNEGAAILKEDLGEDFPLDELSNMLYDAIFFNVKAQYLHRDSLQSLKRKLLQNEFVNDVYYEETTVGDIGKNLEKMAIFILILGLLFILAAVTLIHNTIRLALYSNRFVIKNMELVGASWRFITTPFLRRSLLHGVLSAVLASGILLGLFWYIRHQFNDLRELLNPAWMFLLVIALFILGIMITTLSTYYVVNKYLRMRIDDLY